jgi:hypothetical protein
LSGNLTKNTTIHEATAPGFYSSRIKMMQVKYKSISETEKYVNSFPFTVVQIAFLWDIVNKLEEKATEER